MKARTLSLWLTVSSVVVSILIVASVSVALNQPDVDMPDGALAVQTERSHPAPGPTREALASPITRLDRAIEQVIVYDRQVATWDRSWLATNVLDSLLLSDTRDSWPVGKLIETDRFTIGLFPSRSAADQAMSGASSWYAPEVEEEAGNVWAIRIQGNVRARFLGGPNDDTVIYDGITYQISARTGALLSIQTGLPLTDEFGKPILRDDDGNVIDEAGNIIWPAQAQE